MSDVGDGMDRFTVEVTERKVERAILHALLVVNDHHKGCVTPGADCPVGSELKDVAHRAAPEALASLLGIA